MSLNIIKKLFSRLLIGKIIRYRQLVHKEKNIPKVYSYMHDISGIEYLRNGAWEWQNIENIKSLVESGQINSKIFLDIGANIGFFSCNLLNHFNKILAFEPHPIANLVLNANALLVSGSSKNKEVIKTYKLGLGKEDDEIFISSGKSYNALARVSNTYSENSFKIKVKSLSSFFDENVKLNPEDVSAIKIDVEGFEVNVILGMSDILNKYQPLLLVEMKEVENNEKILNILHKYDYKYFYSYKMKKFNSVFGIKPFMRLLDFNNLKNNSYQLVYFSKYPLDW